MYSNNLTYSTMITLQHVHNKINYEVSKNDKVLDLLK